MGRFWRCGTRLAREAVSVATLYQILGSFSSAQGGGEGVDAKTNGLQRELETVGKGFLIQILKPRR